MLGLPYGFGHGSTAVFGYYFRHWRHLHLAAMVPIIFFLLMMFFVDESPRWLVIKGQAEKAETILRVMAKRNGKEGKIPANFSDIVHQLAAKVRIYVQVLMRLRTFATPLTFYRKACLVRKKNRHPRNLQSLVNSCSVCSELLE